MRFVLLILVVLCAIAAVCATGVRHVEYDSPRTAPNGWSIIARAQPNHEQHVLIALKQRNLELLRSIATVVSDPTHPSYGKYMSLPEINDLVAPDASSVNVVVDWLRGAGFYDISLTDSGDFVRATVKVGDLQDALGVQMHTFKHFSGAQLVRTLDTYTVPYSVAAHIDFIGGIAHFPAMVKRIVRSAGNGDVTPAVIKKQYQIPASTVGRAANNSQGVAQFLEQYYSPDDLTKFFSDNKLPKQYSTVTQVLGPNKPDNPGDEASLDIEYIMGVAVAVPTWFVYTAGRDGSQEPFLEWIVAMNARNDTPLVFSVSYGDDEYTLSRDYTSRVDVEFQKFAASGRSLMFASGDSGVGCKGCKLFVPSFPAGSPWVTAVGATELDGEGEVAAGFGSGGGFANYFAPAEYQQAAVSHYLATAHNLPAASFYNRSGRAYPDVAALGVSYEIVVGGETYPVDGTSCSSPAFAAVIALLNDLRLQNKQPPLGFLNPWLYQTAAQHPSAFFDVTQGSNGDGCCRGFEAAPGWDPVTGLGTPNYAVLQTVMPGVRHHRSAAERAEHNL